MGILGGPLPQSRGKPTDILYRSNVYLHIENEVISLSRTQLLFSASQSFHFHLQRKAEFSLLRIKAIGSLVIAGGSENPCWRSAILSRQALNVKRDSSPVSLSSDNPGFSSIREMLRQEKPEASAAAQPRQSDASSRMILIGRRTPRKYSLSDVIHNKK